MAFYVCFENSDTPNIFKMRYFEDCMSGRFGAGLLEDKHRVTIEAKERLQRLYSTEIHELHPWLFNRLFDKYHKGITFRGV